MPIVFTKDELNEAIYRAVVDHGSKAKLVDVAKHIWDRHQEDLKMSGDRSYKRQYEMRWAANELRAEGRKAAIEDGLKGV
jgi:hypothetical protein